MTLTALPACALRVRSDHSEGRYARTLALSSRPRDSLAARTLPTTTRPITASATFAALGPVRCARDWLAILSITSPASGTTVAAVTAGTTIATSAFRRRQECLTRETQSAALIALDELHAHPVTLLDDVFGFLGAPVLHLRDVQEPFRPGHDLDERSERRRRLYRTFVDLSNHRLGGERLHHLARPLHRVATDRRNRHCARVVDGDLRTRLVLNAANCLSLRPDKIPDLLGVDLHRHDARSEARQLGARLRQCLLHFTKNVHAPLTCLREGLLHDLQPESLDLDVHLNRGDAGTGAGDFEIHVT